MSETLNLEKRRTIDASFFSLAAIFLLNCDVTCLYVIPVYMFVKVNLSETSKLQVVKKYK